MFKRRKLLTAILLAEFLLYSVSPLVRPLNQYLGIGGTFEARQVSIFVADFLYRLYVEDDDQESGQSKDNKVFVRKKRAVIRKSDKVAAEDAVRFPHGVRDDLFVFSEPPKILIVFADIKINKQSFKGFFPLFSGNSPPIS